MFTLIPAPSCSPTSHPSNISAPWSFPHSLPPPPNILLPDSHSYRYDPDSGHDSGAEDATVEALPPFAFLTIGMGKILLGSGASSNAGLTGRDGPAASCTVPLPPRLGICLDYERGRVSFLDAVSFRGLLECPLDCSGPVCPAFCFIGGGAVQLQEPVGTKPERKVTIGGFAKLD